ncbi:dihydrofolate reductase family protein [Salana multivorans]
MSATVLDMSMSVDGFIAGPNETRENGLGDGGERLHEWVFGPGSAGADDGAERFGEHGMNDGRTVAHGLTGVDEEMWQQIMSTGAVLAGRGTFETADGWGGDHHDGVPIFILSRHPAPEEFAHYPLVTYVSDLAAAVRGARIAAGERDVLVHGAGVGARMLRAGLLDEIQLHVVPVLLGQGRRLFDELPPDQVELQPVRAQQGAEVLHLRYRVRAREDAAST